MKNRNRPHFQERIVKISEADKSWEIKFWQDAGVNARFSAAWKMIEEFYKFRGKKDESKQRLQRSVQNIERI